MTLAELRKIAEGATQGPWSHDPDDSDHDHIHADMFDSSGEQYHVAEMVPYLPNRRHIATFNPETALKMIGLLETAKIHIEAFRECGDDEEGELSMWLADLAEMEKGING